MSAPRWTGAGMLWIEAENARAQARPTGVPLTADNVADAAECRDAEGTHVRVGQDAWDVRGAGRLTDHLMVQDAPVYGTVVTKWRE